MTTLRHSPFCDCDLCRGDAGERILEAACALSGLTRAELLGPDRHDRFRRVRSAVLLVARERGYSLQGLAALIGREDHKTAFTGLVRARQRADRDLDFRALVDGVRARLAEAS